MADEKDRFGDKLRDVEKAREDQYFAERDRALIQKLKADKETEQERTLRDLARMRCPQCGEHLKAQRYGEVALDECPACKGVWLDKGELEKIAGRETDGWLARYLGMGR